MGKMIIAVILAATVLAVPFISTTQTITQEIVARPTGGGGGGGGAAPRDRTPPRIYDVFLCGLADTTACICWTTNEWSTSQVEYWASPTMLSPLDETYVIKHRVHLTDLTPGTTYRYKMMSEDKAGNLRVSDKHSFTTMGEAPVKPEPTPPEPEKPEPVAPEPTPPPPAPPAPPPAPEEPPPWLLIGGLIAAPIAGGIGYWLWRRRKAKP